MWIYCPKHCCSEHFAWIKIPWNPVGHDGDDDEERDRHPLLHHLHDHHPQLPYVPSLGCKERRFVTTWSDLCQGLEMAKIWKYPDPEHCRPSHRLWHSDLCPKWTDVEVCFNVYKGNHHFLHHPKQWIPNIYHLQLFSSNGHGVAGEAGINLFQC